MSQRHAPIQDAILEFLADFKKDPLNDGNSPSYKEIADALGNWPGNIHKFCLSMARKGMIQINPKGKLILPGGKYIPPE